jgi:hypothetical protein
MVSHPDGTPTRTGRISCAESPNSHWSRRQRERSLVGRLALSGPTFAKQQTSTRTMPWSPSPPVLGALQIAFRQYRRPHRVEGCPHCVGENESLPLCQTGLNDISAKMISRYGMKAMTTWGSREDYKYFLPRLLELSATPEGEAELGTCVDEIVAKIHYADFATWPPAERAAVLAYLHAGWHALLSGPVAPSYELLDYLRSITPVFVDVSALLDDLDRLPDPHGALQVASMINDCWGEAAKSGRAWVRNADHFALELDSAAAKTVAAWLFSDGNHARLDANALEAIGNPAAVEILSPALDAFQWVPRGGHS